MNSDYSFVCYKHCSKLIFCKNVSKVCPLCKTETVDYIVQPFQVPYPFTNATQNPVSIVIRPSRGHFLHDYNVNNDLHIGIVNSGGCIYEFDKYGIVKNDFSMWNCCIAIELVPEPWYDHWDTTLSAICSEAKWNAINYNNLSMNCFSFVISFINSLKYKEIQFLDKEQMCSDFILPKIQDAIRYILIFKKLKDNEYIIQE